MNEYVNVIKGIAIILVVFGHCIQYGSGSDYMDSVSFFENVGFKIIYSFHMPLFMVVSGWLFYNTVTFRSEKKVIISRFTKLILPVIMWTLAIFIIRLVMKKDVGISISTFLYNFWFLWAVFWWSSAVFVIRRFFADSLFVYIALGILLLFFPGAYNASLYIYMYPYFIAGYFWHKNNGSEKMNKLSMNLKYSAVITVAAVLAWGALLFFFKTNTYVYVSEISIIGDNVEWGRQLQINLFRWLIGFLGSAAVLLCVKMLMEKVKVQRIWIALSLVGTKSLGIYIISGYVMEYVLSRVTRGFQHNILFVIIEAVTITMLSYLGTFLLGKWKLANKLFLGGR